MSDEVDRAQVHELAYRDRALDGVRRAAAQLRHHPSPSRVCGCGELIEEERRLAVPGAKNCIECAVAQERLRHQFRSVR